MKLPTKHFSIASLSTKFILVLNLVVTGYAIASGWSVLELYLLYWFELVLIIIFTLLKLLSAICYQKLFPLVIIVAVFFYVLLAMAAAYPLVIQDFTNTVLVSEDFLHPSLWPTVLPVVLSIVSGSMLAVILISISHIRSFIFDFLLKQQYKSSIGPLIFSPIVRILIMHFTLIFGGLFTFLPGVPILFGIIFLACLKTATDVYAENITQDIIKNG